MRRDSPTLRDRIDHEAAATSVAADPQAVLDAIKQTESESQDAASDLAEPRERIAIVDDRHAIEGHSGGDRMDRPRGGPRVAVRGRRDFIGRSTSLDDQLMLGHPCASMTNDLEQGARWNRKAR